MLAAIAAALATACAASVKLGPPTRPFTCSRWRRSSGSPLRHACSPFLRKLTSTCALRLSSPAIFQSKPSDTSVGGSIEKSPATVVV